MVKQISMSEQKVYIPTQCNGCSNHCPLISTTCGIGAAYHDELLREHPDLDEVLRKKASELQK